MTHEAALRPTRPSPLQRVLPWLSFAIGVASALFMDRGPRRAKLVAIAGVLVWLTLIALHLFQRFERSGRGRLIRIVHRSSLMATQSLIQLGLFFALPFYVQAASLPSWHALFLALLVGLSSASLWDPLSEWMLLHPTWSPLLPAMASFVALDAVLPGLGLSTQQSLWTAAGIAMLGVAALALAGAAPERRWRRTARAFAVASLLPIALLLGFARIIPAAPLRLVNVQIGTEVVEHEVSQPIDTLTSPPERLYCASAIWSPVGLKDKLFHVWRKDGAPIGRIALAIRGGRAGGFRTYSRIEHVGFGRYRCSVETEAGQVLGAKSIWIAR